MHGLVFAALLAAIPASPARPADGARVRFTGVEVSGAKRPGMSAIAGVVAWGDDRYTVRDANGGGVLTLPQPGRVLHGRLVAFDGGVLSLVLDGDTEVARVPLQAVHRLQVARGRDRGQGAMNGAVAGGLVGVFYGSLVASNLCGNSYFRCKVGGIALVTGTIGAALGAGVGAAIGTRRWEPLEPGRVALDVGPRPGGVGLALRIGLPRR